jgi:hypothetical protein
MGDLIQMRGGTEIMQELYDSGIDVSIACMAGTGFLVEIGCEGEMVDAAHVESFDDACTWLKQSALRNYPISAFAKRYGGDESKLVTLPKPKQQPSWSS